MTKDQLLKDNAALRLELSKVKYEAAHYRVKARAAGPTSTNDRDRKIAESMARREELRARAAERQLDAGERRLEAAFG